MENNNKNTFTITLSEKDKVIFDFFKDQSCLDIDEDDEKEEARLIEKHCKNVLERAVKFYQAYVASQGGGANEYMSPNALKEKIKNKSKEELLNIKEMFVNELLRLTTLFDKDAVYCGVVPDDKKPEKFWDVNSESVVAHIVTFANYLSMVDELMTGKKLEKNKYIATSEVVIDEKGSVKLI